MGQRAAYEDTDFVPCDQADWDTTVLERLICAFEEQAMAGVNGFGFIGGDVEEGRVEGCDAFLEEMRPLDVELGCIWISLRWLWDGG